MPLSSFGPPLQTFVLVALWLTAASATAQRAMGSAGTALDRTLATGLAGGFLGIAIVLIVGSVGQLDRPAASALAWTAAAATACGIARLSPLAALRTFGADARDTLDDLFAARSRPWTLLALAVPAALLLHEHVVLPPTAWDALTYHLTFPLHWLQSGGLTTLSFGAGDPSPEYYPLDVEMLFYYGFAATRSDWWAAFAQIPPLLGAAAAITGIARRCGAGRLDASLAAWLWMSLPLILRAAFEPMVDVFLAAFLLSALYFLLRFLETAGDGSPGRALLLSAAVGAGLASGTKYTGPFLAAAVLAPAALPVLGRLFRSLSAGRSAGTLAACVLAAIAAGGYAYARNLWIGANPFLPMEVAFGGSVLFPGTVASDAYFQDPTAQLTLARFFASPRAVLDYGPAFAPLLAVPLVALAVAGRRRPEERTPVRIAALAFVLAMLVFLVVIPYRENRHLLLPVGLGCALLAGTVPSARRAVPWIVGLNAPLTLYYWGKDLVLGGARLQHAALVPVLALIVAAAVPRWRAATFGRLPARLRRPSAPVTAALVAVAWTAFALAHASYHRHRYDGWLRFWSSRYESGEGFSHREDRAETAEAWCRIDELTRGAPATIAYVGNNLPYPLTGRDLANRVVFVPRAGGAAFTGFRRRAAAPDRPESAATWLERVRELGVDYLCVFRYDPDDEPGRPLPVEAEWADARPDTFEPVYGTENALIYRLR